MNYQSHIFGTVPFPPGSYLNTYPNFSNLIPAQYTFDVALGYATGDHPANEYLKRINITLAINNIFNRQPPFEFGGTGNPWAFYPNTTNPFGRNWLMTVSKQF